MSAVLAATNEVGRITDTVAAPDIAYSAVLPGLILVGGALMLMLVSSLMRARAGQAVYSLYTVLLSAAVLVSTVYLWNDVEESGPRSAFAGAIANDKFGLFFTVVIVAALLLSTLVAGDWLTKRRIAGPEFHVLAMLSASGAVFMAQANDLIVVFLGLEILSISLYVLAGFNKRSDRSREAALKYFILGGFSSAIFLYGIALIYGATGSTNLTAISEFFAQNYVLEDGLLLAGVVLLTVGFGFKVAAVPFHQWTPDVYEGAPSPITGFMAAVAKAAAFAAFIRVFMSPLFAMSVDWKPIILVLAILTLLVGSIVACVQHDVKRMLAYSSISHAGYILLGLQAADADGVSSAMFYVLVYSFIVIGSFAIVSIVGGKNDDNHGLEAYRGLAKRHPVIAVGFTVLLLAQAGVPLTSGFLAKFYVMSALVGNGSYATAVFAMLVAAVGAFFYLRLVLVMWNAGNDTGDNDKAERDAIRLPPGTWIAVTVAVVLTVAFGVLPPDVIDPVTFAREASANLFAGGSAPGR